MKSTRALVLFAVLVAIVAVASATSLKASPKAKHLPQTPVKRGFHVQKPATLVDPNAPTWCSVCVRAFDVFWLFNRDISAKCCSHCVSSIFASSGHWQRS